MSEIKSDCCGADIEEKLEVNYPFIVPKHICKKCNKECRLNSAEEEEKANEKARAWEELRDNLLRPLL